MDIEIYGIILCERVINLSRAFLLAGFNNWGKTTLINLLFQKRFFSKGGVPYSIPGVHGKRFIVESHSNDDYNQNSYIDALIARNNGSPIFQHDLFAAFCPSMELNNNSVNVLTSKLFSQFSEIYIFYLEHKWDYLAHLDINEITNMYKSNSKLHHVQHIMINADTGVTGQIGANSRLQLRKQQIIDELNKIFP